MSNKIRLAVYGVECLHGWSGDGTSSSALHIYTDCYRFAARCGTARRVEPRAAGQNNTYLPPIIHAFFYIRKDFVGVEERGPVWLNTLAFLLFLSCIAKTEKSDIIA